MTAHPTKPQRTSISAPLTGASLLIGASLLEVLAMAHHPSVRVPEVSEAMHEIAGFARLSASVHGLLMALLLAVLVGFWGFADQRGMQRPAVRIGLVAYAAGTVMMLGAALVSGFVLSGVATSMPQNTATDLSVDAHLLTLCRILNQTCANVGMVAMSAGIAAWSVDCCERLTPSSPSDCWDLASACCPAWR